MDDFISREILIFILIFEFAIFITLTITLVCAKGLNVYFSKRNAYQKKIISDAILKWLRSSDNQYKELRKLVPYIYSINLLEVMENFDQRLKGEEWNDLKLKIGNVYLLPKARKWKEKSSWVKRNFAARCFNLVSLKKDAPSILELIDDRVFLVRSVAAIAAINLKIKEGIIKIVKLLSQEQGYGRYFYLTILQEGTDTEILAWIEEIADNDKDRSVHLICLQLLASKSIKISKPFLIHDIDSDDFEIRLAAAKVYANNPQNESKEVLLSLLIDPTPEIRAVAVHGLANFLSKDTLIILQHALSDQSAEVRLEAAKTLKNFGKPGINVLEQTPEENKKAYEAAQYALAFDW